MALFNFIEWYCYCLDRVSFSMYSLINSAFKCNSYTFHEFVYFGASFTFVYTMHSWLIKKKFQTLNSNATSQKVKQNGFIAQLWQRW